MDRIDKSVYDRADEGLLRLLEKAKVAALSDEEYLRYEASMKYLEDEIDMEARGFELGMEKGMEKAMEKGKKEGMVSTIKILIESGLSISEIAKRLKISDDELNDMLA